MLFKYRELQWHFFGLKVGLLNLKKNGNTLGLKKTLGKIFQPLNSYTRFPEYHFVGQAIESFLAQHHNRAATILDVGSPKLFGLYLAYHYNIELCLTDITRLNLDEYGVLWRAIAPKAKGIVRFEQQDGRTLAYPDQQFDAVYAMSVVEHIEGDGQDTNAMAEMWRVLKPHGLLAISVPLGDKYMEQSAIGFSYSDEIVGEEEKYFFQRVYDQNSIQVNLLTSLQPLEARSYRTVFRTDSFLTSFYHKLRQRLGENINGLLGFMNPIWSLLLNRDQDGIFEGFPAAYGSIHTLKDIYGDLVLACRKAADAKS